MLRNQAVIEYFKKLSPEEKMKLVPKLAVYAQRLQQGAQKDVRPDNKNN